jgi:hypothetical protein
MRTVLACVVLLTGCLEQGERATTCDGTGDCSCPAGETCSPATPQGLSFGGAQLCDSAFSRAPLTTAVGGTQMIDIVGLAPLPFDVAVDGDAFTAVADIGDTVTITGIHDGSAELRILEPGTGKLYDKVSLDVATATSARLDLCGGFWYDEAKTHAIWAGTTAPVQVVLEPAGGGYLADQSMAITMPAGAKPYAWDAFTAPTAPGALAVGLTLTGGEKVTANGDVVDHADTVSYAPTFGNAPSDGFALGSTGFYAFTASLAGEAINGVPFAATATAPLSIPQYGVISDAVEVDADAAGEGTLTITAGGAHATFQIPVSGPKTAAPSPHPLVAPHPGLAAGERARMLATE